MASNSHDKGSRFTVDLGSVRLPGIVEKQVETEIRGVVLRALARSDAGGVSWLDRSIFDTFPGRTLGLWLDPDVIFPRPGGPLTPEDHTLIMREVMKHPFQVIRYLGYKPGDAKPDGSAVLEAALRVDSIDAFTKDRIKAVLEILPKLDEARGSVPKAVTRAMDGLNRRLAGQPIENQIRILRIGDARGNGPRGTRCRHGVWGADPRGWGRLNLLAGLRLLPDDRRRSDGHGAEGYRRYYKGYRLLRRRSRRWRGGVRRRGWCRTGSRCGCGGRVTGCSDRRSGRLAVLSCRGPATRAEDVSSMT